MISKERLQSIKETFWNDYQIDPDDVEEMFDEMDRLHKRIHDLEQKLIRLKPRRIENSYDIRVWD